MSPGRPGIAPAFRCPPAEMAVDHPRAFGPGVREVLGDDDLVEIGRDAGVALLRPTRAGRAVLVLHQRPPDTSAALDEGDRLAWLAARGPGPEVIAAGRADEGDEAIVIRHGVDATPATLGHPMGPEALVDSLAAALRDLHALDVAQCPLDAGSARLRGVVDDRLGRGELEVATDGPYAGRAPEDLAALFDELIDDLGADEAPVFVHGGLSSDRVWFDPSGNVSFTGWRNGGVGDRHLDLAAAAAIATTVHGPALVAPLFDAYGLDRVDLRRLDAHQLLAHLLL
jgi:aminoglycoside phosphotransferase